jgi:hypothetical protein
MFFAFYAYLSIYGTSSKSIVGDTRVVFFSPKRAWRAFLPSQNIRTFYGDTSLILSQD